MEPARLTLKLSEGGGTDIEQSALVGIRDPFVIEHLSEVERKRYGPKLKTGTCRNLRRKKRTRFCSGIMGQGDYEGTRIPETWTPKEIRIGIEVLSQEQETADTARALARSAILHMGICGPPSKTVETWHFCTHRPNFLPAMLRASALYHLMVVEDLVKPFPITGFRNR